MGAAVADPLSARISTASGSHTTHYDEKGNRVDTTGPTPFERLTDAQIDAMAETLWDFEWNGDPNDPDCFKQLYKDAGAPARRNYRTWARAIYLASLTGKPEHGWFRSFDPDTRDD